MYIKIIKQFKDLVIGSTHYVTPCENFYRLETLDGSDNTLFVICIPFDVCEVI